MEAGAIRPGYELWRPNREKAEAKSARTLVVFLLLVTAALMFVIIIGGWTRLEGVEPLTILYAALYVLFAFLVARWNRGVLPSSPPSRSSSRSSPASRPRPGSTGRRKGSATRPCHRTCSGILCLLLVPIQVILIAVAMVAFNQDWHVEEERPIGDEIPPSDKPDEDDPRHRRSRSGPSPSTADPAA